MINPQAFRHDPFFFFFVLKLNLLCGTVFFFFFALTDLIYIYFVMSNVMCVRRKRDPKMGFPPDLNFLFQNHKKKHTHTHTLVVVGAVYAVTVFDMYPPQGNVTCYVYCL